ncbi:MAG: hypothetical protein HOP08_12785 [Cyclobacteriaceae bacterium]|nr:hypothetical protein [Cyclobacteriaceae bacterium]
MKNELILSIAKPCHEEYSKFTPTKKGGFCSSCQKEVIDFTYWSEEEIKQYFINGAATCGRFRANQLKGYSLSPEKKRQHWLSLVLISILILFSTRQTYAQNEKKAVSTEQRIGDGIVKGEVASIPAVRTISGVIINQEDSLPLPGINIVHKRTGNAVVSDVNGKYSITIKNPAKEDSLIVSFIGLKTQTIVIGTGLVINVNMAIDEISLGEIVIAGGVCIKRSLWWKIRHLRFRG